jgi:hypothetical protein
MTKKEEMPKGNKQERESADKDLPFNPDITSEDKEVLNNQSKDEKQGDYFKDRDEPIDYAGADLDLPEMDDKQFNQTRNEADDTEKQRRPKESANSNDNIESQSETVYKGEKAEQYRDPSKKGKDQNK